MTFRRPGRLLPLAVAAVSAIALAPTASATTHGRYTPGAPGVNDPYFPLEGNGGYDVQHYGVDLSYNPGTKRLDGTVAVTARATQNLSRFDLDLQQLDVSAVTVNGRRAQFRRDGQELVITPRDGLRKGRLFVATVTYGGVPETIVGSPIVFGSPYGFVHTDDGVFIGAEPNGSSTWLPSNDHPSDKAAYTVKVNVPKGLAAISGGELVYKRDSGNRSVSVWNQRTPVATYMATVNIGQLDIKNSRTPGGIPMTTGVDPKLNGRDPNNPDAMKFFQDTTAEATDLWVKTFGPYPFQSAGAIADLATFEGETIGFSLETASRPVYSDVRDTRTIAHEMAHMWFGDSVSVRDWRQIWLNESFATWSHFWWQERHGSITVSERAKRLYDTMPADWWKVKIADPQRDTMFHDRVYSGGAMVLQFLREKVGDETFFKILRTWYAEHRNGNASTPQFTALVNRVTGQDYTDFFDKWIYSTGKPTPP